MMYWSINESASGSSLPGGATNLNDLTDVAISTPQANQVLKYDGTTFINSEVPGLASIQASFNNLNADNLTAGTINYARLPNLAGIVLSGDAVPPYIESITPITPNGNQTIEIIGEYFSPITQLNIPGVTVNSLAVRSPNKIIANISKSDLSGNKIIILANGTNTNQIWAEGIKSIDVFVDPYWANVSLFVEGDGDNNSTNIVDSSLNPKIITRGGDTKISTVQSKYGGSSIYFDGSGDLLQIANDPSFNFGAADFTIEFWIFPITSNYFLGKGDAASAPGSMLSFAPAYGCSTYFNGGSAISPAISFSLNQWQHIAIVRNSSNYTIFKNGATHSSATLPAGATINTVASLLQFGGYAGQFINAYFDSIRITNMARYTNPFNPEIDTFLNA